MSNTIHLKTYFSVVNELIERIIELAFLKSITPINPTDKELETYLKCLNEISFLNHELLQMRNIL